MKTFRLLFLSGASGSGTTLLARILSAPPQVIVVAGKHRTIPREEQEAFWLAKHFNRLTRTLWDREADFQHVADARRELFTTAQEFFRFPRYADTTHILLKRSAPFYVGDRYRPDLRDITDQFPDVRIVIIYRDPRASTASSQRRKFAKNLRNMAVICEEQLIQLSAQLQTIDPALYRVVSYERWIQQPDDITRQLAAFTALPEAALLEAVAQQKMDPTKAENWRSDLSDTEQQFLDTYFDAQRQKRWEFLAKAAQ